MHSLCGSYYANWHKRLGIPVVIIGGVTASSIFSSNKDNYEVWTYINGSLALLVAALSGISSFVGTAEKQINIKMHLLSIPKLLWILTKYFLSHVAKE